MFDLLWLAKFIKIGTKFGVGTQFARTYNLGSRPRFEGTIFIINQHVRLALGMKYHKNLSMFPFVLIAKFYKNQTHCNFETKSAQAFNFGSRYAISNIIFMINKLDLLWVLNFIAPGIFLIVGTKFSWNEEVDTCFNVECGVT